MSNDSAGHQAVAYVEAAIQFLEAQNNWMRLQQLPEPVQSGLSMATESSSSSSSSMASASRSEVNGLLLEAGASSSAAPAPAPAPAPNRSFFIDELLAEAPPAAHLTAPHTELSAEVLKTGAPAPAPGFGTSEQLLEAAARSIFMAPAPARSFLIDELLAAPAPNGGLSAEESSSLTPAPEHLLKEAASSSSPARAQFFEANGLLAGKAPASQLQKLSPGLSEKGSDFGTSAPAPHPEVGELLLETDASSSAAPAPAPNRSFFIDEILAEETPAAHEHLLEAAVRSIFVAPAPAPAPAPAQESNSETPAPAPRSESSSSTLPEAVMSLTPAAHLGELAPAPSAPPHSSPLTEDPLHVFPPHRRHLVPPDVPTIRPNEDGTPTRVAIPNNSFVYFTRTMLRRTGNHHASTWRSLEPREKAYWKVAYRRHCAFLYREIEAGHAVRVPFDELRR